MAHLVGVGLRDLFPMERSLGNHVTHAIRRLCVKLGHFEDSPFPDDLTRLELGQAFEEALIDGLVNRIARGYPDRFIRPGEQMLEGIYGTPDLIDFQLMAVVEIKLTWLSCKWGPDSEKFWKYWKQGMAYAKMLGLNKVQLWVCHINGNWKFGRELCPLCYKESDGPHLHVWEDDFEQAELDSNWEMIRKWVD